jgi:hypothetical protein
MPKFPRKAALAGAVLIAAAGYAVAAQLAPGASPMQPHDHMQPQAMPPQGATMQHMMPSMMGHMNHMGMNHAGMNHTDMGMPGGMTADMDAGFGPHAAMSGSQRAANAMPTMPGQEAFGTIQEILRILEADPSTDWSKVDIGALREHLIDMDEVTMRAIAKSRMLDGGVEFTVTGTGRTLAAIKRMVPTHTGVLRSMGWNARAEVVPDGVKLTVMASEAQPLVKLKALGFIGIMAQGANHQPHHLMMAKGEMHMPAH